MFSGKCKHVAKLLEQEKGFPLTNVDLKLFGFKPFKRKDLSKWDFLYPSDSHILPNIHTIYIRQRMDQSSWMYLSSAGQKGAAHACAFLSRAPWGKSVPSSGCHCTLGWSAGFTPGKIRLPSSAINTCAVVREGFLCPL